MYVSAKGSQGLEESCDSDDDLDAESKGPVLSEVEEEAVESVIASLPSSDLGRSAAQTQGSITIHCINSVGKCLSC